MDTKIEEAHLTLKWLMNADYDHSLTRERIYDDRIQV